MKLPPFDHDMNKTVQGFFLKEISKEIVTKFLCLCKMSGKYMYIYKSLDRIEEHIIYITYYLYIYMM